MAALAKGFFRGNQRVNESPQEATPESPMIISLTEAPEAIDQFRIRLEKP